MWQELYRNKDNQDNELSGFLWWHQDEKEQIFFLIVTLNLVIKPRGP